MKILTHCCLLLIMAAVAITAQTVTVDDFEAHIFTEGAGSPLPYRLFVPRNYNPALKYPLILFLHGAGERGTDNRAQLSVWSDPLVFVQSPAQTIQPCFMLAPQCPWSDQWVNVPFWQGSYSLISVPLSPSLQATVNLVQVLQNTYSIDASRLYVTGLSMGGYGAWDLLTRYSNLFAAAIPICGGGDPSQAAAIALRPVWAFHSADDSAVPVSGTRAMIAAMQQNGGSPLYTEYPSEGHFCWIRAYATPGLPAWLFAQQFPFVAVSGTITLQGTQNAVQPLTFTFHPTSGSTFTRTATLDASGTYSLANIPKDSYTLSIKGVKWLRQNLTIDARSGSVSSADAALLAGDANDDNAVDVADLLSIIYHYNKTANTGGYLEACDFNCDGANDVADLLLVIGNYNKLGDF